MPGGASNMATKRKKVAANMRATMIVMGVREERLFIAPTIPVNHKVRKGINHGDTGAWRAPRILVVLRGHDGFMIELKGAVRCWTKASSSVTACCAWACASASSVSAAN